MMTMSFKSSLKLPGKEARLTAAILHGVAQEIFMMVMKRLFFHFLASLFQIVHGVKLRIFYKIFTLSSTLNNFSRDKMQFLRRPTRNLPKKRPSVCHLVTTL